MKGPMRMSVNKDESGRYKIIDVLLYALHRSDASGTSVSCNIISMRNAVFGRRL